MKGLFGTSFFALAIGIAGVAQAQSTPGQGGAGAAVPSDEAPEGAPLASNSEDIIVTAQNRSESVQDVPIAINVVGGEALRNAGVADFRDLARVAPQLNITNDANYTRVAVRGVGTNSNDESQDQSIAINIDGEYLNRPNILNISLFDIDRVEVLRGPQGTLYGRNATGGAINFITRKPGETFAVNGSVTYGNYDAWIVEGGVNVPFAGFGGLRLSGIYNKHDGYFYHPNINARSGTADTIGGRASLRLNPTDALTIDFAAEYVEVDNIIPADAAVDFNVGSNGPGAGCAQNGFVEVAPLTPGTQCVPQNTNFLRTIDRERYNAPATGLSTNKQESLAFRGRLQYDFGPAILTYSGGFRKTDQDADIALHPAYVFYEFKNNTETQSHELRLNGGTKGSLIWQVGGFYYNEQLDNFRGLYGRLIAPNGSFINTFTRDTEAESLAAFAQVDVPLGETLTAVGGIRYTDDKRTGVFGNYPFRFNSGPVAPTTPPPTVLNLSASGNKLTWLAGLNYQPNSDTLLYGKVSTGYKAGGFDSIGAYGPETNTAYEAGAKLNFGEGGRNTFNLSGFYYDYKDLQVSVLLNPNVGGQIFNAGAATIWGIEAELTIRLDDNDRFTGSVNYLKSKYDNFLAAYTVFCVGCADTSLGDLDTNPATVTQPNLAGNRLPQAPRWTITTGYDHTFSLGAAGELTASVYSRFKSDYFLNVFNQRDSRQTAFTQSDLNLTYRPVGRTFSVQGFVRNLENEQPLAFGNFTAAGNDDIFVWQFGAPRTYGVKLAVDF